MNSRWIRLGVGLLLAVELAALAVPRSGQAYSNAAYTDWTIGGPHRTINEFALTQFVEQAKTDEVLGKYDFAKEVLALSGPRVGEPGLFVRGNWLGKEDKAEPFQWWVKEGGYSADEPELYASFRHFYDPRAEEMDRPAFLTDHLEELGVYFTPVPVVGFVVTNPQIDARDWAINGDQKYGVGANDYSWNEGVEYVQKAFASTDGAEKDKLFAQGWRALGETMHLLADMTTPAHVRNDSHPAIGIQWEWGKGRNPDRKIGKLKGDAYELWAQEAMIRKVGKAPVDAGVKQYLEQARDPLDLFHRVALFTNTNFFSAETVSGKYQLSGEVWHSANGMPDYPSPKTDQATLKQGQFVKTIGSQSDVCLAHLSWLSQVGWGSASAIETRRCVESQAAVLIPTAVAGNARLLDWFVPRIKVEITDVNAESGIVRGTVTHIPYGAYANKMSFNTPVKPYRRLVVNDSQQNSDEYQLEVTGGALRVTLGDKVTRNIESARASGDVVVYLAIDMGGIQVRSNDYLVSKKPRTPTPGPTLTLTTQATEGVWTLSTITPTQSLNRDSACYFNNRMTIASGSFSSSYSWTDKGCVEGGTASGSVTASFTWAPPAATLKPGSKLTLTVSGKSTAQQTGGGRNSGGWMYLFMTEGRYNGGRTSGSKKFFEELKVNGWTANMPVSGSTSGSLEIPNGKKGGVLEIVASCSGPSGGGTVLYTYLYK